MSVTAAGVSHAGRVRQNNEDSLLCDQAMGLFLVADGMGGHQAGEVASQMAVESIRRFIESSRADRDLTWPFGYDPGVSVNANRLATAVRLANRRVFQAGEENADHEGMGTTIVGALLEGPTMTFCGVGDSRVYLWEDRTLRQLTHDDSWVATVLASDPTVDRSTLARHPMRHVLTNVLGAREDTPVEVGEEPLQPGALVLLCSDGLYGAVDETTVGLLLSAGGEPDEIAERLIQAALDRNASDNVTAIVLRRDS